MQLAETVDGVSVTCHQPLVHQAQEKKIQHTWTFIVHSEVRVCIALSQLGSGATALYHIPHMCVRGLCAWGRGVILWSVWQRARGWASYHCNCASQAAFPHSACMGLPGQVL